MAVSRVDKQARQTSMDSGLNTRKAAPWDRPPATPGPSLPPDSPSLTGALIDSRGEALFEVIFKNSIPFTDVGRK